MLTTLIHIVSYKQSPQLIECLEAISKIKNQDTLKVVLTDNASEASWLDAIQQRLPSLTIRRNEENLGFCAAHNQGAADCIAGGFDGMLVLNPDVVIQESTVSELWRAIEETGANAATPLLVRTDNPAVIDAAGMYFTKALRHFDRFSGEYYDPTLQTVGKVNVKLRQEYVVGGTGACLLLTKYFLTAVSLPRNEREDDLFAVYPQLQEGNVNRLQVFDEAFFAYREDAELALRSQVLGLKTVFVPTAIASHGRGLKPKERSNDFINLLGVKNRFLLQWSTVPGIMLFGRLMPGLWRNFVVIAGVLLWERSSLPGLYQATQLYRRAQARKRELYARAKLRKMQSAGTLLAVWFSSKQRA